MEALIPDLWQLEDMEDNVVKERRYTRDHEWVDFYETHLTTGVSWFKLIGIRKIDKISFVKPFTGFRREGEPLAVIICNDYQITAHMPVDGYIVKVNETLDGAQLLNTPESEGWIAVITPWEKEHNTRLLPESAYSQKYKRRSV
ncbi:hypothetical protein LL912_06075 [Niabella sp. CC-SYL272]|uniref:hypothetical protein n=1 Tax=Niabella agricola TaxID=2891571 RepID=UPI001F457AD7|nr:hypothetical protein [Niabella agricola]MCF3108339.1 hypothetical protein [Niabella agricola]